MLVCTLNIFSLNETYPIQCTHQITFNLCVKVWLHLLTQVTCNMYIWDSPEKAAETGCFHTSSTGQGCMVCPGTSYQTHIMSSNTTWTKTKTVKSLAIHIKNLDELSTFQQMPLCVVICSTSTHRLWPSFSLCNTLNQTMYFQKSNSALLPLCKSPGFMWGWLPARPQAKPVFDNTGMTENQSCSKEVGGLRRSRCVMKAELTQLC